MELCEELSFPFISCKTVNFFGGGRGSQEGHVTRLVQPSEIGCLLSQEDELQKSFFKLPPLSERCQ